MELELGGKVDRLERWREEKVDPFVAESKVFRGEVERFLTTYEAQQESAAEAIAQRHTENAAKLNRLNLLGTVCLILIGVFGLVVSTAAVIVAILSLRHMG